MPHPPLRAIAFGAAITATAQLCGNPGGDARVPLQPPGWVFGVVWPALYVTTGWAWARAGPALDGPLGTVTALCCGWLVVHVCLRRRAAAVGLLAATVVATVVAQQRAAQREARLLLAPLVAWTSFATYLNAAQVWGA